MLNQISLMGRLTRDPELRYTGNQISVLSFSVANDRDFKSENGPSVDFIDCVAWRGTADFINKYFKKGDPILVTGRLQVRTWKDNSGANRRVSEVLVDRCYFCGSKSNETFKSESDGFIEIEYDGDLPF